MLIQNYLRKHTWLTLLISLCYGGVVTAQSDDRTSTYYSILASEELEKIDAEIVKQSEGSTNTHAAYAGALLMKKAGLIKNPVNKLKAFKAGRAQLESAIGNEPENPEFRLLRIMIQEKAPSFLGYNKDMEKDRQLLTEHYNKLPPAALKALVTYSKTSNFLNPSDFQP